MIAGTLAKNTVTMHKGGTIFTGTLSSCVLTLHTLLIPIYHLHHPAHLGERIIIIPKISLKFDLVSNFVFVAVED